MARNRASMREGPLAELFRATEAAQRQAEQGQEAAPPGSDARRAAGDDRRARPRLREGGGKRGRACAARALRACSAGGSSDARGAGGVRGRSACAAAAQGAARLRTAGHSLRGDARARAAARVCDAARQLQLPRRDPGHRCRRRRPERGQPDDRRRHLAGRVRRGQHGHAAAPALGRAGQDPHRPRPDAGSRLGRRAGYRPPRGRGELRPDQERPSRLRHGLRHRRRGRGHRHGRCTCRREDRARARCAHRRHRHDAVPVRGHAPQDRRPTRASSSSALPATP